ncbi:MAG: protein-L-isoaspartate family protein [Micavibrio sp.]|nr:protein-L-isoaspartate family protein [Micavibrio sp.]
MSHFSTARINMVDSQIHTAGVVTAPILEAFRTVPRENYVPEEMRGLVYADEDLSLGNGHFLMEPAVLARMLEAAEVNKSDRALSIGDSTGYSAAILTMLAGFVTTADRVASNDQFSLIVVSGAVAEMPPEWLSLLALRGRIVAVLKPKGQMGVATEIERIGENSFSTRKLFDAGTPYLPGFEPRITFTF